MKICPKLEKKNLLEKFPAKIEIHKINSWWNLFAGLDVIIAVFFAIGRLLGLPQISGSHAYEYSTAQLGFS
jgi:hypothetical protein